MAVRVAVVIPFRGDAGILRWCLEGYARQKVGKDVEVEVLVGGDGCEVGDLEGLSGGVVRFKGFGLERMGAAGVRNELVGRTDAEVVILGNADARPEEGMVQKHVESLLKEEKGTLVLGSAPWEAPPTGRSVFDALLSETPMVFFYGKLRAHERYDFRHAWSLNLSVRREDYVEAGGFARELRPVYYEDLAFGFGVMGGEKKGVLYVPEAKVVHRHPTTLEQYLNREELLGLMSPVLGRVRPKVFAALHGGRHAEELEAEYQGWVEMDGPMHKWIYERLKEWTGEPESVLSTGELREQTLMTIYQMHVPLKRLAFRLGFLKGMEMTGDERWEERVAGGMWRRVVG